jgi:plastocyanin domain-containing protein
LPLNKPVVVAFTPNKSGGFSFTCGMGMLRGKIVVQEK